MSPKKDIEKIIKANMRAVSTSSSGSVFIDGENETADAIIRYIKANYTPLDKEAKDKITAEIKKLYNIAMKTQIVKENINEDYNDIENHEYFIEYFGWIPSYRDFDSDDITIDAPDIETAKKIFYQRVKHAKQAGITMIDNEHIETIPL